MGDRKTGCGQELYGAVVRRGGLRGRRPARKIADDDRKRASRGADYPPPRAGRGATRSRRPGSVTVRPVAARLAARVFGKCTSAISGSG